MSSLQGARRSRRGFTLLESLIVVAVMALLASAAIPMASKALSSSARKATRAELVQLGVAAQEFFRDTAAVPASIEELQRGPYLTAPDADASRPATDFATDAWSRPYRLKRSGDVLSITSSGPDAASDTPDDVHILVDFTPIRREETLKELETIRRAVSLFAQQRAADETLAGASSSANRSDGSSTKRCAPWSETLAALVAGGFLDSADTYRADAWGNAYEARPDGSGRIGRIVSTSIAATPGAPVACR
jgi:prepilin-type N-terminal cleavage/methylation domain-containing protein